MQNVYVRFCPISMWYSLKPQMNSFESIPATDDFRRFFCTNFPSNKIPSIMPEWSNTLQIWQMIAKVTFYQKQSAGESSDRIWMQFGKQFVPPKWYSGAFGDCDEWLPQRRRSLDRQIPKLSPISWNYQRPIQSNSKSNTIQFNIYWRILLYSFLKLENKPLMSTGIRPRK